MNLVFLSESTVEGEVSVEFWFEAYLEETWQDLSERLYNIYCNIIELCFRLVKKNTPYLLLFFKYD